MRFPALSRSRLSPVYLLVVAVAAAATLLYLTPSPQAHAESGRRICYYVWNQNLGNPEGRLVSFVVDYKKDGRCPQIDHHRVSIPREVGSWMPPADNWEHQPAPKMTCEEVQSLLELPPGSDGGDPCTYLEDDRLYAVTSSLPDDTAQTKRFWGLRPVGDLGW